MLDPRHLQTLSAVLATGGFEKAAQSLFLTQSAVSQRIRQLEEQIGQPVLTRTNPVAATAAGRQLLQHYRQLNLMEHELMAQLRPGQSQQPCITLAVSVNADSMATWFLSAVQAVLQQHRLLLDILIDDQDYTHELMRSGHVAACVGSRPTPIQGGECHFLGYMRYLCLATPAFVAQHFPQGADQQTVAQAPAIIYSQRDNLHHRFLKQALGFEGDIPRMQLPNAQGFLEATRLGLAYSLLPEWMCQQDLQQGSLIDVFPGQQIDLPLYWHHWRVEPMLARDLAQALTGYCQQHLWQGPAS